MNNQCSYIGLCIVALLAGCVTTGGGSSSSSQEAPANQAQSSPSTKSQAAPAQQSAKSQEVVEEADPNFIKTPRLSSEKFGKLWNIATNKCYDLGYAVTNNDKATKNLMCQVQNKGATMALRVRFADEGIYVTYTSSAGSWKMFGGDKLAYKTKQHKDMKGALIAGLR